MVTIFMVVLQVQCMQVIFSQLNKGPISYSRKRVNRKNTGYLEDADTLLARELMRIEAGLIKGV